jgi:maltooligosyltrehalose trehalohydrolase
LTPDTQLGATYLGDGRCQFRVWAPNARGVEVHLSSPSEQKQALDPRDGGYFHLILDGVEPGALYSFSLDGGPPRPDPASRHQPEGVHGPSEVVDPGAFTWNDQVWSGLSRDDLVIYELHVGTFSDEGTFDGVIPYLDELEDLGITAIEILPVNAFPGERNWGYDGVLPFAVQHSYGGPDGLRRLVDACHQKGLGIILDIVYNHFGPEGNYLSEFGPYFTDQHLTPWGTAINYDAQFSDHVREYFLQNGRYWLEEYHFDGFRLDAIHAIYDQTAKPFLEEWTTEVHRRGEALGHHPIVIAESMMNDPKVIQPAVLGGFGMDAEWNDDFHHALHVLLTGERDGYYADYSGVGDLAKAFRQGYVYTGEHMGYRGRRHGRTPHGTEPRQFLAYTQTHDQVGNHGGCARLSQLTSFEGLKLAAGAVLLSPFTPMLFMGEEYGEPNPWWYFVDHGDPDLREAVRQGRRNEFAAFDWEGEMADPASVDAYTGSRLQHQLKGEGKHRVLLNWYRDLLRLRREKPALRNLSFEHQEVLVYEPEQLLFVRRWRDESEMMIALAFADDSVTVRAPLADGNWQPILDSGDERWHGPGTIGLALVKSRNGAMITFQPQSCVLFERVT